LQLVILSALGVHIWIHAVVNKLHGETHNKFTFRLIRKSRKLNNNKIIEIYSEKSNCNIWHIKKSCGVMGVKPIMYFLFNT
jgi:hypothetical protein